MNRLRYAFWPVAVFLFAASLSACSGGGAGTPSVVPSNGNQPPPPGGGTTPYTSILGATHYQKVITSQAPALASNSPLDLTFFGGPVLKTVVSHDININCTASCWGTAGRGTAGSFLRNLATSGFIHIVDQYTGTTSSGRYTVASDTNLAKTLPHTLMLSDLAPLIHDAAVAAKSAGYGNEEHLFFPKGQDVCIDSNTCYSPDNPPTFIFCAFHGSADFSDVGHVIFSVEPYQFVPGCFVPGTTPSGVIDATSSTLSHELIESITDPDGNAWFNTVFGFEIGDECLGFRHLTQITATFYDIQSEYSNATHACVSGV